MNGNGHDYLDPPSAPGRVHRLFTVLLMVATVGAIVGCCVLALLASDAR